MDPSHVLFLRIFPFLAQLSKVTRHLLDPTWQRTVLQNLVIPSSNDAPRYGIECLQFHIRQAAARSREEWPPDSILWSYGDIISTDACHLNIEDEKAKVNLAMFTADILALPDELKVHLEPYGLDFETMDIQTMEAMLHVSPCSRWVVEIPDREFACDLIQMEEEGCIQMEEEKCIQMKEEESIQMEEEKCIQMRPGSSVAEVREASPLIPLDKVSRVHLGYTYLSHESIDRLIKLEERAREETASRTLHEPVLDNLQAMSDKRVLDLVICLCSEKDYAHKQALADIKSEQSSWSHALGQFFMSLLICLAKRKYIPWFPWPLSLGPLSNRWVFLLFEVRTIWLVAVSKVVNFLLPKSQNPFRHDENLLAFSAEVYGVAQPRWWERMSGFLLPSASICHFLLGWKYRSNEAFSFLEWADMGIGVLAHMCTAAIKILYPVTLPRDQCCLAGMFNQLAKSNKVDQDQLDRDVVRWLVASSDLKVET